MYKRYLEALKIRDKLGAKDVLDVGCASGHGTAILNAIGTDINRELLMEAKRNRKLEVIKCDAHHLPFRQTFELAVCFEVIEHVSEPHQVLSEIFQALKPRGTVLLTSPNKNFLRIARLPVGKRRPKYHVKEYSPNELKIMVEDAGFAKVEIKGLGAWIPDFLVRNFPKISDYLGGAGLNYAFFYSATK